MLISLYIILLWKEFVKSSYFFGRLNRNLPLKPHILLSCLHVSPWSSGFEWKLWNGFVRVLISIRFFFLFFFLRFRDQHREYLSVRCANSYVAILMIYSTRDSLCVDAARFPDVVSCWRANRSTRRYKHEYARVSNLLHLKRRELTDVSGA